MNEQMTDVRVCSRCDGLFMSRAHTDVCNKCQAIENYQYIQIKDYLATSPDASMHDIYENCHVDRYMIEYLLREERISLSEASSDSLDCMKCGIKVKKGKYCKECLATITNSLQGAYHDIKEHKKRDKSVVVEEHHKVRIHNLNRIRFEENHRHR